MRPVETKSVRPRPGSAKAQAAVIALIVGPALVIGFSAQQGPVAPVGASLSTGFATDLTPTVATHGCTNPKASVQPDVFPTKVGTVRSTDGKEWTVPGPVGHGATAVDL